jgi:hypothetical protein
MGCCGWRRTNRSRRYDEPSPAPAAATDAGRPILERHLAEAEADLVAATRGEPLCRLDRGPQVGSVKYAEGRHAALRELRLGLRSANSGTLASAVDLLAAWESARARSETQGPEWQAYRSGGVAALRGLVEDLTIAAG